MNLLNKTDILLYSIQPCTLNTLMEIKTLPCCSLNYFTSK